jgi:hypothetical protein
MRLRGLFQRIGLLDHGAAIFSHAFPRSIPPVYVRSWLTILTPPQLMFVSGLPPIDNLKGMTLQSAQFGFRLD